MPISLIIGSGGPSEGDPILGNVRKGDFRTSKEEITYRIHIVHGEPQASSDNLEPSVVDGKGRAFILNTCEPKLLSKQLCQMEFDARAEYLPLRPKNPYVHCIFH